VSSGPYPPDSFDPGPDDVGGLPYRAEPSRRTHIKYRLQVLLFLLTLLSTTLVGTRLQHNFQSGRPAFDIEADMVAFWQILTHPASMLDGLTFSATLMLILLAHEMGHYLTCTFYGVNATLPFFMPAPSVIGTFGAFIRIKSPIYSKRILFDVGVAGPLAGFVFLIPALGLGMALSKVMPGIALRGDLVFGTPLIVRMAEWLVFPGVPASDIYLHPVARAAWVGAIATALNLLPIGQSDGGHVVYSFFGARHRLISRLFIVALIPLGIFYWYGWLVWAAFFVFFGMRHPPTIYDDERLGPGRRALAWTAFALLALSFSVAPIQAGLGG
jgi:membrane-associated protease RseP (regulator of RpoE activity)